MKRIAPLILLLTSALTIHAQTLFIRKGTAPTIDGSYSPGEWTDADSITITTSTNGEITIHYKRGDSALYLGYSGALTEGSQPNFPEFCLDLNNDKSNNWMGDDWWFHVSLTDCEGQGISNDYSTCAASKMGWLAEPNWPLTGAYNELEISVDYSFLGQYPMVGDTIGLMFDVSNTVNRIHAYPASADTAHPSTWANAVISDDPPSNIPVFKAEEAVMIFPNPAQEWVKVKTRSSTFEYELINIQGQLVDQGIGDSDQAIPIDHHQPGLYFMKVDGRSYRLSIEAR